MTSDTYLSQLKILYVEDDDDTREDLRHYLRKKAGRVVTASSGTEGLQKYEEEHPDIVIADILLPGMSGIDMLKAIRAAGGKAPFIITSSVDSSDTIIEAVETGIVRYVLKPIILDDLLDALNKTAAELCSGSIVFDEHQAGSHDLPQEDRRQRSQRSHRFHQCGENRDIGLRDADADRKKDNRRQTQYRHHRTPARHLLQDRQTGTGITGN